MQYAEQSTRPIVMGTNGMAATGHPLATQAAVRVLQDGGNAIDAAVTAAGVLAVTKPNANSVGGDMFLLYHDAERGKTEAMNASGRAPQEMTLEVLAESRRAAYGSGDAYTSFAPGTGPHAASVPGVVRGWADALDRYGTISLEDALQPAIRYAESGFPVSVYLSRAMASGADMLRRCRPAAEAYLKNGQPYAPGEVIKLPHLAHSLDLIARQGPDVFYTGELGQRIVEGHREDGGLFSMSDFERQESVFGEPLAIDYRGYQVCNQRPVSMGTVLLEELKIVEQFDLAGLPWDSPERLHLLIEAKKLAFADCEAYITDPDWFEAPLAGLLSDRYAAERAAQIDPNRASDGYGAGDPARYGDCTTYFCVVDGKGNVVSWIQTLFHNFGSGWMAPGTGILLTDRMNGFSVDPNHVNRVEGGKRTAHTLNAPMVFKDGQPCLVFGTPGGYGQVQSNLQMLTSFVDHGFDVQAMVEAPRWLGGAGRKLSIESRYATATLDGLRQRGHELDVRGDWTSLMGGAQAIRIDRQSGVLEGAADPRREGYAIGW